MTLRMKLAAVAVAALAVGITPAFADNGKSKGHTTTHGNSGQAHGNSSTKTTSVAATTAAKTTGKGGLASELKGLNAVRANPNALEHAAPGSQVGRIALYRDAALATNEIAKAQDEAAAALAELPVPTATVEEVDAAIALLDPAAVDYAAALAALEEERADIVAYNEALAAVADFDDDLTAAQDAEDAALLVASGGRSLSDEAIAYIRSVLNL
jgi:hypothetical protein